MSNVIPLHGAPRRRNNDPNAIFLALTVARGPLPAIRDLYAKYQEKPDDIIKGQLLNLRKRMKIIRNMQVFGALSFFFSVLSLMTIFIDLVLVAEILFGVSLLMMLVSLLLLIMELNISVNALNIQLKDFDK